LAGFGVTLEVKEALNAHIARIFGAESPRIGRAIQPDAVIADRCAKGILRRGDSVF